MYKSKMKRKYFEEVIPFLMKKMNYKSVMEVPRLKVIYINRGIGKFINDKKFVSSSIEELSMISGQRAVYTKAKKSISNFKLRLGMFVGVKVTLRDEKMYEFFDRLVTWVLPRIRDFQGLSKNGFDKNNNYNLGIKEQIIFPEIRLDKISKISGMNITFITDSKKNNSGYQLLKAMGMPFRKEI